MIKYQRTTKNKKYKVFKKIIASFLSIILWETSGLSSKPSGISDFWNIFSQNVEAMNSQNVASEKLNFKYPWEVSEVFKVFNDAMETLVNSGDFIDLFDKMPENIKDYFVIGKDKEHPIKLPEEGKFDRAYWRKITLVAPPLFKSGKFPDISVLVLDVPRRTALVSFFKHIVSLNPMVPILDILYDVNLVSAVNNFFGQFNSSNSVEVALTGGFEKRVTAHKALSEIILEEEKQKFNAEFRTIVSAVSKNLNLIKAGCVIFVLSAARGFLKDIYGTLKNSFERFKRKLFFERRQYSNSPYKMLQTMQKNLKENIVGQEKPISEICKIVVGWLANGEKNKGPLLLVLTGSSGVGKTLAATEISKIVYDSVLDPNKFVISSSIKLGTDDLTPAEKLFSEDSQLVINLRNNPYQIIIFDDYDKSQKKDPDNSVLETLARVKESGMMPVRDKNGKIIFIDVKSAIFIITTNQLLSCWGGKDSEESLKDPTRTNYPIDQSLSRRFRCVEFNKLDEESYKKILKPKIDLFVKKCKENYEIICSLNEKCVLDDLARDCVLSDKGARGSNDLIVEIWGALIEFLAEKNHKGIEVKNIKMEFDLNRRFIFSLN
ncbi:MAG: hypothetical protein LBJ32_03665 [Oscillospiraceae bacterium]|nr:hypothetical protein [Oscillospiraceae bacterium]